MRKTYLWPSSELTSTPRHGDRPWEIAHIDHTQLDIELLSSLGKPLGRPWATFLVDAYSRRLLAVYLTFDRHIKVDVATAEHLVEKKRARGKTTTRYPDDPEMRDVYEEELRRLRLRALLLDEAQH